MCLVILRIIQQVLFYLKRLQTLANVSQFSLNLTKKLKVMDHTHTHTHTHTHVYFYLSTNVAFFAEKKLIFFPNSAFLCLSQFKGNFINCNWIGVLDSHCSLTYFMEVKRQQKTTVCNNSLKT